MKTTIAVCSAAIILSAITFHAGAEIIAGPITNPANGHDYYLLTPNTWTASEAEAENLGGTMAIIKSGADQKWVFSKFGSFGGEQRTLWIGLHRKSPGGAFTWVDGSPVDYTNRTAGEPNNAGGNENCVQMQWDPSSPGRWNDNGDSVLMNSVVEIPKNISITKNQRELVGEWYASGQADRPSHIANAGDTFFAINETSSASRLVFNHGGFPFVVSWQVHGEIVKDKILWSNGTGWSRKPVEYGKDEKSSDKVIDTESADAEK